MAYAISRGISVLRMFPRWLRFSKEISINSIGVSPYHRGSVLIPVRFQYICKTGILCKLSKIKSMLPMIWRLTFRITKHPLELHVACHRELPARKFAKRLCSLRWVSNWEFQLEHFLPRFCQLRWVCDRKCFQTYRGFFLRFFNGVYRLHWRKSPPAPFLKWL